MVCFRDPLTIVVRQQQSVDRKLNVIFLFISRGNTGLQIFLPYQMSQSLDSIVCYYDPVEAKHYNSAHFIISAFGRLRQEDGDFKASLGTH